MLFLIFWVFFLHILSVERIPQIPRRPLTVAMSLKTQNLTTRPIKVLQRFWLPLRTGVYKSQIFGMLHEKILCVNTEPSSPKAKDSSRFGCAGVVNPGCSSYLGCRAPSIPEGQDLSRSSSNDSSLASVVEENETETTEDYDTGMVSTFSVHQPRPQRWETCAYIKVSLLCALQESLSSAGTPHKRDSFTYSTWLEDSSSSASTTSRGTSPGKTDVAFGNIIFAAGHPQISTTCIHTCINDCFNTIMLQVWVNLSVGRGQTFVLNWNDHRTTSPHLWVSLKNLSQHVCVFAVLPLIVAYKSVYRTVNFSILVASWNSIFRLDLFAEIYIYIKKMSPHKVFFYIIKHCLNGIQSQQKSQPFLNINTLF